MVTKTETACAQKCIDSSAQGLDAVWALPARQELLMLLAGLLNDESALAKVAALSYRHQLGFEKYVLATQPSGACLRMHFWIEGLAGEEDIHSHCADFSSRLLLGRLTEQKFNLVPGQSHSAFRYRFDAARGESEVSANGLTAVEATETQTLFAGDSYFAMAKSLHRVIAVEPGTVTVSSWRPRRHDAVVLKPASQQADPCCVRAGMDVTTLRARLRVIHQRIAFS